MVYFKSVKHHLLWLVRDIWKVILLRLGLWRSYVLYWDNKKVGKCVHCGNCCHYWGDGCVTGRCKNLVVRGDKFFCKIYNSEGLNFNCRYFPVEPLCARLDNCQGFSFERGSILDWLLGGVIYGR